MKAVPAEPKTRSRDLGVKAIMNAENLLATHGDGRLCRIVPRVPLGVIENPPESSGFVVYQNLLN